MQLRQKLVLDYYLGTLLHVLLKPLVVLLGKVLRRDHDLSKCTSVTVIKMLGGGSLVIAYPALLAIKKVPHIRTLRLLTTPAVRPFAEALGIFDEVIVIRDDSPVTSLVDALGAIVKLFRCDAIVDLEIHSRFTTVFSLFTCAVNRIGFYTRTSYWRRSLSSHLLFCNAFSGIYYFYDQIAELMGGKVPDFDECHSKFRSAIGEPLAGRRDGERLSIALAPCCSDLAAERMLTHEEWIEVLRRRLKGEGGGREVEITLLGGPADRTSLDQLAELIGRELACVKTVNLAGKTRLIESIRQIARSDELLCIDSALLHFGRLLGIPTVSFWGPTDPESLLRPWPNLREEVHYTKLPCSPCVHIADEPPCLGNNVCMRLSVHPDSPARRNPPWIVPIGALSRFSRSAGP